MNFNPEAILSQRLNKLGMNDFEKRTFNINRYIEGLK